MRKTYTETDIREDLPGLPEITEDSLNILELLCDSVNEEGHADWFNQEDELFYQESHKWIPSLIERVRGAMSVSDRITAALALLGYPKAGMVVTLTTGETYEIEIDDDGEWMLSKEGNIPLSDALPLLRAAIRDGGTLTMPESLL